MFRIFFDNFQYYSQHVPADLADAKSYCMAKGFDATVLHDGRIVAHYSAFMGGWRTVR
jgi:hypothetical protein